MEPTTLNERFQQAWERSKRTALELIAIIIASISGVIAIIAMFVAAICIGIIVAQQGRIEELSDKIGVLEVRIQNHEHKGHDDE